MDFLFKKKVFMNAALTDLPCLRIKVRTNFQKKLLMVELSWMNTDAQTEVNMFLRATEMNPSQISLGGFFDVNRNLFKSVSIYL